MSIFWGREDRDSVGRYIQTNHCWGREDRDPQSPNFHRLYTNPSMSIPLQISISSSSSCSPPLNLISYHTKPSNSRCPNPSSSSSSSSCSLRFSHKDSALKTGRTQRPKTILCCVRETQDKIKHLEIVREKSVSVVLLAGGKGKRMGASMPKQYLPLLGQPIALYSFYTFSCMAEVKEIVVVCDPSYKDIFEDNCKETHVDVKFALPGKERQDSVFSGLQEIDPSSELICVHDSARPLVSSVDIKKSASQGHYVKAWFKKMFGWTGLVQTRERVFLDHNHQLLNFYYNAPKLSGFKVLIDGWMNGAAVLGVPVKATIKEASNESFVVKTLDRKTLWEMQTPQVMKPELLRRGFELVNEKGLEVTDDVSIVEHLNHPVYISTGSYTNIKVTTPDDMLLAERILSTSTASPSK